MPKLSDFAGPNPRNLQAAVGASTISANDLVVINSHGQLASVQVSNYAASANAGSTPLPLTTLSPTNGLIGGLTGKEITVSPTGDVYAIYPNLASDCGVELVKLNAAGTQKSSFTLDGSSLTQPQSPQVQLLADGNILATWFSNSTGLNFAILDSSLNELAGPTQIAAAAAVGTALYDTIPLSGGGFAVAFPTSAGLSLGIYGNLGNVVSAVAAVSGAPAASAVRLAQISNGNIAMAITSAAASKVFGQAIYSATGALVLAYTVLNSGTSTSGYPTIVSISGFYACAFNASSPCECFVFNNAGVVQGGAYSGSGASKLLTDGSIILFAITGVGVVLIPTTGTGYVVNSITSLTTSVVLDRGFLVYIAGSSLISYIYNLTTGALSKPTTTSASSNGTVVAAGDFCLAVYQVGNPITVVVQKYIDASVFGVAQATVAAGNAGALLLVNHGGGFGKNGFTTNPIGGTVGLSFDHSGANVVGNKGTMFPNSAALEGII